MNIILKQNITTLYQKSPSNQENIENTLSTPNRYARLLSKGQQFSQLSEELKKREIQAKTTGNQTNGSYFLYLNEKILGVYKPRLQVKGAIDDPNQQKGSLRKGIPAGTEAFRERLAYALNDELNQILDTSKLKISDFGVPPTEIKDIPHELFGENHKTGSLQKFKKDCLSLYDMKEKEISIIPKDEFLKTAVFDFLSLNTDRHLGNLLYSKAKKSLSLIDHGACFPELKSIDELSFDWEQAPFVQDPFPEEWRKFILNVPTKKLFERFLTEMQSHQKTFSKEEMKISAEALFAFIYAIEHLKHFVKNHPTQSIKEYVTSLIKRSHPYAIIEDPTTKKAETLIELSPNHTSHPQKKKIEEQIYEKYGFNQTTIKRKDVGGQFVKNLKNSFQKCKIEILKKNVSIKSIWQNFDKILKEIASELNQTLFESYNDLLLKSLNT